MSEGKIEDVTQYQALRNILRGQRAFAGEIVPILNLSYSARSSILKPTGERVGIAEQLRVGIGSKQSPSALEPAGH